MASIWFSVGFAGLIDRSDHEKVWKKAKAREWQETVDYFKP